MFTNTGLLLTNVAVYDKYRTCHFQVAKQFGRWNSTKGGLCNLNDMYTSTLLSHTNGSSFLVCSHTSHDDGNVVVFLFSETLSKQDKTCCKCNLLDGGGKLSIYVVVQMYSPNHYVKISVLIKFVPYLSLSFLHFVDFIH